MANAKRESVTVRVVVRKDDGTFDNVDLVVHPPNNRVMRELAALGLLHNAVPDDTLQAAEHFLRVFAALVSRTDKERGTFEWMDEHLEPDDIVTVIDVVASVLGYQKPSDGAASPNVESPSP